MMDSDKITIAIGVLITLSILVSVAGTLAVLNSLNVATPITGFATSTPSGTAQVTVGAVTYISLPVSTVDFDSMENGDINDTTDDSPEPFQLQNDGTVNVNITVKATDLFSGTGGANPSIYYQFACGSGELACPEGSATSMTNMANSTLETQAIANIPYGDSGDQLELDINVTVPHDESAGVKSSTITFTATQS